jgi:hypothetical protein
VPVPSLAKSPPVSTVPIAARMLIMTTPVWPRSISISSITNRRICAAHRFAVTVPVPGRVGTEVRKTLRERGGRGGQDHC